MISLHNAADDGNRMMEIDAVGVELKLIIALNYKLLIIRCRHFLIQEHNINFFP